MPVFLYLFITAITLLLGYLIHKQNYWRRRQIPHEAAVFLRGNMTEWRKTKQLAMIFRETYEKFKDTGALFAGFYFYTLNCVVLLDLELIKTVLIKDFAKFPDRGIYSNERDDPLTGNLFFLDGEKWRQLRHKMTPTFTSGKMKHMFSTVSAVGEEFSRVIAEKFNETGDDRGMNLEITNLLGRYTADVIGSCAFGLECNSLRAEEAEFVRMGRRFMLETRHNKIIDAFIRSNPRLARRLRMRTTPQDVHDFYMRIVRETIEYREQHNVKRHDFMDMLIELKNHGTNELGLSVEDVAAQAFVFFLAGFETSSTTMSFVLYELARHPETQDKVRKDILQILEQHQQVLSYYCMKDIKYLDMVISETLRMYPVAGQLVRRSLDVVQTSDPKYYIEKDCTVIVPIWAIHLDPQYYPEPEKFVPERFTPEEIEKRPTGCYLPFGDGPRNCIGMRFAQMQMTIGLVHLLQHYRFSVCPETQIPLTMNIQSFSLSPENGIHLKVEKL